MHLRPIMALGYPLIARAAPMFDAPLPAYVAGEAAVPAVDHDQLLGLLVGVNLGPLVAPWGALATLIWFDTVRREGVAVPLGRFLGTSALTAAVTLAAALEALVLTR